MQPLPRAKPPPSKRIIPQGTRLSTAFQVIKGSADGLNFRKLVSPGRAKSTIEIKMAGVASSIPRKKGGREKKRVTEVGYGCWAGVIIDHFLV